MSGIHSETVACYSVKGKRVDVDLCWKGKDPEDDPDRFYDLYDEHGICLNEGEPWHDDGSGTPTVDDVATFLVGESA
jgi:hypothetical protein